MELKYKVTQETDIPEYCRVINMSNLLCQSCIDAQLKAFNLKAGQLNLSSCQDWPVGRLQAAANFGKEAVQALLLHPEVPVKMVWRRKGHTIIISTSFTWHDTHISPELSLHPALRAETLHSEYYLSLLFLQLNLSSFQLLILMCKKSD